MKTHEEIVNIAKEAGYDRFHPDFFVNSQLNADTWLLELTLVQKWLRDHCWINVWVAHECVDSETYEYAYEISFFPKEKQAKKRLCEQHEVISSFQAFGGTYWGAWKDYTEALNEGIYKALSIALKEAEA